MIEKILVIALGLLVLTLTAAALLCTLDWKRVAVRARRARRWHGAYWNQLSDTERKFWTWYGRAAWASLLVVVAVKGW